MATFTGFPKEMLAFYKSLDKHNNKDWFEEHRDDYENYVMEPAQAFVDAMGVRLREIAPKVVADPRVNQSIFKIHRDIRFSKDKTPFKTNLAMIWWEGARKKLENSCYYFHLEAPYLLLGLGIYQFPKPHLETFRESVDDSKHGAALVKILDDMRRQNYVVTGQHFKKVPRGYAEDHPRADLLKYNGLTVGIELPIPDALHSAALVDFCFDHFKNMTPVHRWLVEMTERIPG